MQSNNKHSKYSKITQTQTPEGTHEINDKNGIKISSEQFQYVFRKILNLSFFIFHCAANWKAFENN